MAVSRGEVRHKVTENAIDLFRSFLMPNLLEGVSSERKAMLQRSLQQHYPSAHVALFPFARTCFYAILKALNLPKGSKILMTPITIGPMVEIIESLGYQVVFVDIETESFGPCLRDLQDKINQGAACFLLTHLFGYVSDLDQVVEMCRTNGVYVLEDVSHNLGCDHNDLALGLWGDVGFYSASLLKYVDGYNGAFTITRNPDIGISLEKQSTLLTKPDKRRIRTVILKTLVWNIALSRWIFSVATWPGLRFLKSVNREAFERVVGPGIPFKPSNHLPAFYFEQITNLQAETIQHNLHKLLKRIQKRRKIAQRALSALGKICLESHKNIEDTKQLYHINTYWQFVISVKSTEEARSVLYNLGVETNTTNLRDLAHEYGIHLVGARTLKERCIFIPLHDYLKEENYFEIFKSLQASGQLVCKK